MKTAKRSKAPEGYGREFAAERVVWEGAEYHTGPFDYQAIHDRITAALRAIKNRTAWELEFDDPDGLYRVIYRLAGMWEMTDRNLLKLLLYVQHRAAREQDVCVL